MKIRGCVLFILAGALLYGCGNNATSTQPMLRTFVTDANNNTVFTCNINSNTGVLESCEYSESSFISPAGITLTK